MGKMSLENTSKFFLLSLSCLCIALSSILLVLIFNTNSELEYSKLRTDSSILIGKLEQGKQNIDTYEYFFTDSKQEILDSTSHQYPLGTLVNIYKYNNEIEIIDTQIYYNTPVIIDGKITGHLVIIYPLDEYLMGNPNLLYIVFVVFILMLYIGIVYTYDRHVKKDILYPLQQMQRVTDSLLAHMYNVELEYDIDNEIGVLCHNLEMLRDDLLNQENVNSKYHEKEQLLLACISHDLRTPLATISGYVEGISIGLVKSEKDIKQYTDVILGKIRMLNKLIDDILEHSEIDMNALSIHNKEEYSKDVFEKIVSDLSLDVHKHNRKLMVSTIPNLIISIDKKRIMQVMQNLVSNALKYTDDNGCIEILFSVYKDNFIVTIKDDGSGIPTSDIPFIFNKFYRGEKARTLNIPGSGLGLNIVKNIIEKHGGKVSCESTLGQGTSFTFNLKI